MKSNYFLLVLLTVFLSLFAKGQLSIWQPTVTPSSPLPGASIKVITKAFTTTSGTKVSDSLSVNHSQKKIKVKGCYSDNILPATKTYIDTFYINALQSGTYSVVFTAYLSSSSQVCLPVLSRADSVSLVVNGSSVSLQKPVKTSTTRVFPNPAKNELFIESGEEVNQIEIYNISGTLIKTSKGSNLQQVNTGDLPDGIYFLQLQSQNSQKTLRFIKISG